jgi:hypothetical protein
MTELDALRAEIAALWIALKQVNENQQVLAEALNSEQPNRSLH